MKAISSTGMESKLTPNKYMKVNTGNIFFPRVLMVILLCLTASSIFAQSKAENKTGEFCTRTIYSTTAAERIHAGKKMRQRIQAWRQRGLFVFYLPTCPPHLHIAETIWRKLKYEWLSAEDYESKEHCSMRSDKRFRRLEKV